MKYRKLGASDLNVSEISLGSWLTYGVGVERDQARRLRRPRLRARASTSSTPPTSMAAARRRRFLGEALARRPRDSYVLATKVFFPMSDDATRACRARRSSSRSTPR